MRNAIRTLFTCVIASSLVAPLSNQAVAQPHCPTGELPVYAHNDYQNAHPLHDAIALGYRGAEVDVFLIDGVLRVGHDRRAARKGPRLDSLYMIAIRDIVLRCNRETAAHTAPRRPFLLNIEIKEESVETLTALYPMVFEIGNLVEVVGAAATSQYTLNLMLVGFNGAAEGAAIRYPSLGVACKLERITWVQTCMGDSRVRMLSVDYGKSMGRWWTLDVQRERWLQMLRETKKLHPAVLLRVFNAPYDARIYQELLHSGVDLIGTKDLQRTRRLLTSPR